MPGPEKTATALVIGVGGNVSQGIVKALAMISPRPRVIAACVSKDSAGLYMETADAAYVCPYADDPQFGEWLLDTCRRESVDVVMSGVEEVLERLAGDAANLKEQTGAVAVVSPAPVLAIGRDKLKTAEWLRGRGLPAPRTVAAEDSAGLEALIAEFGKEIVLKPRLGKGSAGVVEVPTPAEIEAARQASGMLAQERIGDAGSEFTAATFSDVDGAVRGTLAMRRRLQSGTTSFAEAGEFPEVRTAAAAIAAELVPLGPCNMQFRLRDGEPVCFEINTRFSGTTPIRARFGFNDVESALFHIGMGEPAADLPVVTDGVAFRLWEELYPGPAKLDAVVVATSNRRGPEA